MLKSKMMISAIIVSGDNNNIDIPNIFNHTLLLLKEGVYPNHVLLYPFNM